MSFQRSERPWRFAHNFVFAGRSKLTLRSFGPSKLGGSGRRRGGGGRGGGGRRGGGGGGGGGGTTARGSGSTDRVSHAKLCAESGDRGRLTSTSDARSLLEKEERREREEEKKERKREEEKRERREKNKLVGVSLLCALVCVLKLWKEKKRREKKEREENVFKYFFFLLTSACRSSCLLVIVGCCPDWSASRGNSIVSRNTLSVLFSGGRTILVGDDVLKWKEKRRDTKTQNKKQRKKQKKRENVIFAHSCQFSKPWQDSDKKAKNRRKEERRDSHEVNSANHGSSNAFAPYTCVSK